MQICVLDAADGRAVDRFGSRRARHAGLARLQGQGAVSVIRLEPGGVVGRHPAMVEQLFCVIEGAGWVSGANGARVPVTAGQVAHWTTGETHESGSESGMTALVIETEQCSLR